MYLFKRSGTLMENNTLISSLPNHLLQNQSDIDLCIKSPHSLPWFKKIIMKRTVNRRYLGCSVISLSHLFKIFDFIFQDDAVGTIWLLPGKGDAIFSYLPFFHTTDWRRCCKTGEKQNRQNPWLVRQSVPAKAKLVTVFPNTGQYCRSGGVVFTRVVFAHF